MGASDRKHTISSPPLPSPLGPSLPLSSPLPSSIPCPPPLPPKKAHYNCPPLSNYAEEIIQISSLCVVAMEMSNQAASSTPVGSKIHPALITGCTAKKDNEIYPMIIAHSLRPIPTAPKLQASKLKPPAPTPDADDLYDLILEHQLLPDDLPIVNIPPSEGKPLSLGGASSSCIGTATLELCLPLEDFKLPLSSSYFPQARHIVPIPEENLIAVIVAIETTDKGLTEGLEVDREDFGALLVYRIQEGSDHSTTIDKELIKRLRFTSKDSCFVNLCPFSCQKNGVTKMLLAAVTFIGSVRVYDVREMVEVMTYTDSQCKYTHCVYCKGIEKLAVVGSEGFIHFLDIEEIGEEADVPPILGRKNNVKNIIFNAFMQLFFVCNF